MKQITFYFDFISPYAYLAFEKLPQALQGLSYSVQYKPVLFAAFLNHYGQLGPAEIAPKRTWTYRQMLWHAREQGVALQAPASHPFNPISLLRLALACGDGANCNRYVAETIFREVWTTGQEPGSAAQLQALTQRLQPARPIADDAVKAELKTNTDAAIAAQVFGVPTIQVDDEFFWGFDALPMLRQYLNGDAFFTSAAWRASAGLPVGVHR
jgi:2-hydroxychromene-2-carboxylate isomerase